jgi:hypothetical protein
MHYEIIISPFLSCMCMYLSLVVERPYVTKETFRGREKFNEYWRRQVLRKQRNISFPQLKGKLLYDAERDIAIAKWEAEFLNFRATAAPSRRPCGKTSGIITSMR